MIAAGVCSPLTLIAAAFLVCACAAGATPAVAQQDAPAAGLAPKPTRPKPLPSSPQPAAKPASPAPRAKPSPRNVEGKESVAKPKASTTGQAPPSERPALPPPAAARLEPLPPVDTSTPPPLLPRASRERMRACAEKWDQMKRRGTAGLPTWREFATQCLTLQGDREEENVSRKSTR